jgi:hypothetical protein
VKHVIPAFLVEITKDFRESEEGRKTFGPLRSRWLEEAENDLGKRSPRSGEQGKRWRSSVSCCKWDQVWKTGVGLTIQTVIMNVTKSMRGQFYEVTDHLTATVGPHDLQ